MPKVKCAVIQQMNVKDVGTNVEKSTKLIHEAADDGAQIICLQELFNTAYWCHDFDIKHCELAETIPGPTTEKISKVAQETGTVIVTPIFQKTIPGQNYNSAAVIGPDGEIIGTYQKMSIPRVTSFSREGVGGDEKLFFRPGDLGFPTFDTPFGVRIGILICYDRHFPEAARCLALGGAELMLVPTATLGPSIPVMVAEQKGHAIANCMYVGLANTVFESLEGGSRGGGGNSFFVDPKGEIMSESKGLEDQIVHAEIDTKVVEETRNYWGFFRDRRPDAYGALVK
ncbi:MAG: acyltransferase [bacterium]|nr:acyltransferase [bacterium]